MGRQSRDRVVVLGIAGRTPFAGVAWQVLHYLEGFKRLGYDVYYLEDTGDWPYDAERNTVTDDAGFTVRYVGGLMARIGMEDRWAYRSGATREVFGLGSGALKDVLQTADVLINLTGATILTEEHLRIPVRVYVETDPVMPQIEVAQGRQFTIDVLAAHTHHFTYGENIGRPDCPIPAERFVYRPTRQPIVLDWWTGGDAMPDAPFTTIASWRQSGKDIEWNGETYYWSKHHEFLKFLDLPSRVPESFELALACGEPEVLDLLHAHGWRTRDALVVSRDLDAYRNFIRSSRGEFTVAKDQNIRLRSGWFSDRSASYLAAGRPVITQDTGFASALPVGEGLFAFRTMADVLEAFDVIRHDYRRHSLAAREIAESCFSAETVLEQLMQSVTGEPGA